MNRHTCTPRPSFRQTVEAEGMLWVDEVVDGVNVPYWTDAAYYSLMPDEVDRLEAATKELWGMSLQAARWMLNNLTDTELGLPAGATKRLLTSMDTGDQGTYARFDLCLSGDGSIKMIELNGDTPTMLVESAVSQWNWHREMFPETDQWNSLHERLVDVWAKRVRAGHTFIHFTGCLDIIEELSTLGYLADVAQQAGAATNIFDIRDLGRTESGIFVDESNRRIDTCFKLYPWEEMLFEPFGRYADTAGVNWVEPLWRSALSTKALLAALWHLFPDHPLLLPSYLDHPHGMRQYVAKPLHGREGASIRVVAEGQDWTHDGAYGAEGYCFQQWNPLPDFGGNRPVLGSWVVDGYPAGLGIRECDGPITDTNARFAPHLIEAPAPDQATRDEWLREDGVAVARR